MTPEVKVNIQLVRSFLQALEGGEVGESLALFFTLGGRIRRQRTYGCYEPW